MVLKTTRSSGVGLITPNNTLEEATDIVRATKGTVKDVKDAKKLVVKEGWVEPGETISLETLARILLAHSLHTKVTPETASIMAAVAHLITPNLQEGVAQGVAKSVTELLKHSIASMTLDIRENLELHANKLTETAQAQATIAQGMQKTQEDMAESARQAATQVRPYNQVAATHPNPPSHPTPPITHSLLQIQNREQVRR